MASRFRRVAAAGGLRRPKGRVLIGALTATATAGFGVLAWLGVVPSLYAPSPFQYEHPLHWCIRGGVPLIILTPGPTFPPFAHVH